MNSTFKVVFNKARGALMVVNEVTSSVQAKGTKTVVATAVAAMIAGVAGTAMAEGAEAPADTTITVKAGETIKDKTVEGRGGAYYIVGDQKLTVGDGVTFQNNKAVVDPENSVSKQGGAVSFNYAADSTFGDNVVFTGNSADGEAGALHIQGTNVTIGDNVQFMNNTAKGHAGGAIYQENISEATTLTIGSGAVFEGNKSEAHHGGAIFNWNASSQGGQGAEIVIGDNAKFTGNTAKKNGGAVANYEGEITVGAGATFASNVAEGMGGAIYNDKLNSDASLTLEKGATFTGNKAAAGGAIYNNGGVVEATLAAFKGNEATGHGGALFLNGGSYDQTGGTFEANKAVTSKDVKAANGGAIRVQGGAELTLENVSFVKNTAAVNGGAIDDFVSVGIELTNVTFEGNEAGGWGGAVRLNGGNATFTVTEGKSLVYSGNKAGTDAEGAVAKNYAGNAGDFMYIQAGSTAEFKIEKGASLTISDAIAGQSTGGENGVSVTIEKTGEGKLTVADFGSFVGDLTVSKGTMEILGDIGTYDIVSQQLINAKTKADDVKSAYAVLGNKVAQTNVTVEGEDVALVMGDVTINRRTWEGTTNAAGTTFEVSDGASLTMKSLTLGTQTYEDKVFDKAENAAAKIVTHGIGAITVDEDSNATVEGKVTIGSYTELAVTGAGKLTVGGLDIAAEVLNDKKEVEEPAGRLELGGNLVVLGDSKNSGLININNEGAYSTEGTLTIAGGTFDNAGKMAAREITVQDGATLTTGVALDGKTSYVVFDELTLEKGSTLNLTGLNSKTATNKTDTKDLLTFNAGTLNLEGGAIKLNDKEFTGPVSIEGDARVNVEGAYAFDAVAVKAGKQVSSSEGTVQTYGLMIDSDPGQPVTIKTLENTGAVGIASELTVTDKFTNKATAEVTGTGVVVIDEMGALNLTTKATGLKFESGAATVTIGNAIQNYGVIALTDAEGSLKVANVADLVSKFNATDSLGIVKLGDGVTVSDADKILEKDGTLKAENATGLGGVELAQFKNVAVTDVTEAGIAGSFGSVKLKKDVENLTVTGGLVLNGTEGVENLVADKDGKVADIALTGKLTTTANGNVGSIIGDGTNVGDVFVEQNALKVFGDVDVDVLSVAKNAAISTEIVEGATARGEVKVTELAVEGSLVAGEVVLNDVAAGEADAYVIGSMTVDKVTLNDRVLQVGTDEENWNSAGKLIVKEVADEGVIFADPAWKDGNQLALGDASQVAVETITGSTVVAGQGSIVAVGTMDADKAVKAVADAGYTVLGANEGQIKAAVYVEGSKVVNEAAGTTIYTPIDGNVIANGWTDQQFWDAYHAGTADLDGVQIKANNLMIINMDTVDTSDVDDLQKVFDNEVINEGTIYLANAELGDKVQFGTSYQDNDKGVITFNGDRLMSAVAKDNVHTIGFDEDKLIHYEALETLPLVMAMYEEGAQRGTSKSAKFNSWLMSSTNGLEREQVIAAGNDVASIVGTAGMANVTMDALSQFNDTVAARTSVLAKNGEGVNVWADVNGGKFEGKKVMDGAGYSSDIYAGVIGVDTTVACGAKIGAALTVGTADTDSQNTTAKSSMDSDLFGVSIYTAKQFGDFNVAADIGYMQASNDVNVQAYNLGKFSADSDAFTIGVRGELLAKAGSLDIVPHVGLRWTRLSIDNFEAGYTTDIENMNVFQMPIGVTISGEIEASGWTIAPAFDLSVVPTWGDKDLEATLGIGGVSLKEEGTMRVLDSNVVNATLGVAAQNGAWTFGLDYKLGVGSDDRLNNSFNARVNYAF